MPRPKNTVPSYSHHKPSNQAFVRVPDGNGGRRQIYLGRYNSPESRAEYARIVAELAVAPAAQVPPNKTTTPPRDITLVEVYRAFRRYAEQHYRRADGTTTNELPQYDQTFRLLLELYGHTPAREFGPLGLKAVREKMVGARWSRKLINQRVGRIKRVMKWAASEELIPATVHQALSTVAGLQAGRTNAPERAPVKPVDDAVVNATLPYLNRHVRGLVEFQRLTGCRPGEACHVRWADIDASGAVWLYRPAQHKTGWRGKSRVIAVGPKAQQLLDEYFVPDITAYLFSPRRAVEELHAARSANRKTPRFRSHMERNRSIRVVAPKRPPAERYTVTSYEHAIARACDKAFPPPGPLAPRAGESQTKWWKRLAPSEREAVKVWRREHRWAPNQLRHSHATEVRKRFGLEAAQVALGHSHAAITEVYAEKNVALAATVAAAIG